LTAAPTAERTNHGMLAGAPGVLEPRIATVLEHLASGAARRGGPLPAGGPSSIAAAVNALCGEALLRDRGTGDHQALAEITELLAAGAADPADPACAGHLHCPPLAVAVAADVAVSALNQSLDSWDQAPAAIAVEERVVSDLAELVGYDRRTAGGVMTSGGTESNLMGLLLARDAAVRALTGVDAATGGISTARGRLRVLCSAVAHFSVQRSAALLGLGEDAVVPVPVDDRHRMDPAALHRVLAGLRAEGLTPAAIVATAGTTDFGSVDPLPAIAELARAHGAWLHVDAAYGGGALFSTRLAPLLDGLAGADSIALDLHKLGWQPVPAGVFLARTAGSFAPLARQVAYLNPADDEDGGFVSLLGRSLRTTRRADAVKLAVTFRALGRDGLGELVDACHDLARHAADAVAAHPRLELTAAPVLTTVVFRYRGGDAVNARLRRTLLRDGRAVIGRTEIDGRVHLKLTLLNPHASRDDVDALLALVAAAGDRETP
jgi:L-2,4-diaminobutyrate decarboxylase